MGGGTGMIISRQFYFCKKEQEGICSFSGLPVETAFSTMGCGNMSSKYGDPKIAEQNFRNFCSTVGVSSESRVHIHPEHGNNVVIVDWRNIGDKVKCDGLITVERGLMLSLFPADCFPVVLTDEEGSFVGLIHGGRKSVKQNIITKAVAIVEKELKKPLDSLIAAIGPGIMCCCYGTNLLQEITEQLLKAGIRGIAFSHVCTYCSQNDEGGALFFSHERSYRKGELEGRFAAIAARR